MYKLIRQIWRRFFLSPGIMVARIPPRTLVKTSAKTLEKTPQKTSLFLLVPLIGIWIGLSLPAQGQAQQTKPAVPDTQTQLQSVTDKLDEISDFLDAKRIQRDELNAVISGAPEDSVVEEREKLQAVNNDIARLRSTFELLALGDVDLEITNKESNTDYDWRQEVVEIVAPLLESLKSVTERPRQKTELRESIALNTKRLKLAEDALRSLESLPVAELDPEAVVRINRLNDKWIGERQSFEQDLLVDRAQLERLDSASVPLATAMWPALKQFLLGRGLTLLMVFLAAVVAWAFMRTLWWVFSTRFLSKEQRRTTTWYRLLSYSYFILNMLVIIVVAIAVLYIREDLLLLALAVVLIAVTALGLRRFVPAYMREARLLINMGAVREGERVVYRGLPWQVMSLNLETILRNPALDGVLRLPLEVISELQSRPFKDTLWFSCEKNDFVILPDGTFGQVAELTPELVQLKVKGGMIQSWITADFYALNITNLSRGDSYGIAVTFGYAYELQPLSLTTVAPVLKSAIEAAMKQTGHIEHLVDLMVEFKSAGASSLDYLVYATIKSEAAGSYYSIERVIQQACVAVANQQGWSIPYPQMTIHRLPIEAT